MLNFVFSPCLGDAFRCVSVFYKCISCTVPMIEFNPLIGCSVSEREVRYTLNDAIRLGKLKNSSGKQEFSARISEGTHHITKHAFWKTN